MKYRIAFAFLFILLLSTSLVGAQQATTYSESPMLADRVTAGTLPPVADRLPENPRVISLPGSDIGTYGGDFRDPFVGDSYWSSQMIFWTVWKGLVSWNPDYSDWVPNIAESVDVSPDATSYTFHLRQGLKWSDGVPFTADDVVFYIDDILNNPELNGGSFPDGFLKPGKRSTDGHQSRRLHLHDHLRRALRHVPAQHVRLRRLGRWSPRRSIICSSSTISTTTMAFPP